MTTDTRLAAFLARIEAADSWDDVHQACEVARILLDRGPLLQDNGLILPHHRSLAAHTERRDQLATDLNAWDALVRERLEVEQDEQAVRTLRKDLVSVSGEV